MGCQAVFARTNIEFYSLAGGPSASEPLLTSPG